MIPIDRAGRRARRSGRCRPPSGSSRAASSSASIPRARAAATATCTAATPARPAWRSAPARRSCRSASAAPGRSGRPVVHVPHPWRPVRLSVRSTDRDEALRRPAPTTACCCARSSTRSCTRSASCRASRTWTSTPQEEEARCPSRRPPTRPTVCREPEPVGAAADAERQRPPQATARVAAASTPSSTTPRRPARRPTCSVADRPEPALSGPQPVGRQARVVAYARSHGRHHDHAARRFRAIGTGRDHRGRAGGRHRLRDSPRTPSSATVNGVERDLVWPLADGDTVSIVTKTSDRGLYTIRHSTTHVMAQAVLDLFPGATFAIGPPVEDGFYYDFQLPPRRRREAGHVQARGPRPHRRPHARDPRRGPAVRPRRAAERQGPRGVRRPPLQAGDHRRRGRRPHVGHRRRARSAPTRTRRPSRRTTRRSTATPASSTCAAARTCPTPARSSATSS